MRRNFSSREKGIKLLSLIPSAAAFECGDELFTEFSDRSGEAVEHHTCCSEVDESSKSFTISSAALMMYLLCTFTVSDCKEFKLDWRLRSWLGFIDMEEFEECIKPAGHALVVTTAIAIIREALSLALRTFAIV